MHSNAKNIEIKDSGAFGEIDEVNPYSDYILPKIDEYHKPNNTDGPSN